MSTRQPKRLGRKLIWLLGALVIGLAVVAYVGIFHQEKQTVRHASTAALPRIEVMHPQSSSGPQELVLPGEIQAWYTAPILARVNGYVKMWYKDYGAKVKAGDLLAEIDTPDLDQQYDQAKADLAAAQANLDIAQITAKRWDALRGTKAVSQQSADVTDGEANARTAEVAAARAKVGHLEAVEEFKKVVAPFDGVVTARNVDVGALVSATPSGNLHQLQQLFDVADIHMLRIFVQVPQVYVGRLRPGMKASLELSQYPNRLFDAELATTSDAITKGSRSLLVELHRDNKDGLLQPGSFVEVHFKLPADENVLSLPTSALIFRDLHPEVATVDADDKIALKRVVVGRDLGTEVEILSGLSPSDRVVRSPSDSIAEGTHVEASDKKTSALQVIGDKTDKGDGAGGG